MITEKLSEFTMSKLYFDDTDDFDDEKQKIEKF